MDKVINMRKIWKVMLVLGVGILLTTTVYAYNFKYTNGCIYCTNETNTTNAELQQKAEELLRSAEVKEVYGCRFDSTHYVLLKDGEMVGIIWKGVKDDVSIGTIIPTKWGAKATLMYNGEVVGQLFVDGKPMGWQKSDEEINGHRGYGGYKDGCSNGNGCRHGYTHGNAYGNHGNGGYAT